MCEIGFFAPEALTDSQFHKLSSFIHTNVGIKMPDEKRLMVQSRLTSRLKSLKMDNFDDYLKLAFSNTPEGNEEIALMINAVTTNLTNFFRENAHFEYLTNVVLPELAKKNEKKNEQEHQYTKHTRDQLLKEYLSKLKPNALHPFYNKLITNDLLYHGIGRI